MKLTPSVEKFRLTTALSGLIEAALALIATNIVGRKTDARSLAFASLAASRTPITIYAPTAATI